jgi:hypothetical protein
VRVELVARVTTANVRLQVDVGFGDVITPEASVVEFPPLLDFPAPRVRAYPRETVVAECGVDYEGSLASETFPAACRA